MRRFVATLLLVLLPLQFIWAAAAPYCAHESRTGAEHFGHHDHPHPDPHATDTDSVAGSSSHLEAPVLAAHDGGDGKAPGAADLDCGHCHVYFGVLLLPTAKQQADFVAVHPPVLPASALEARAPPPPERPQWRRFA